MTKTSCVEASLTKRPLGALIAIRCRAVRSIWEKLAFVRLLLCRPNRTGLRASSQNTAAQARFASAQRVIFSIWCWGSPGEKVARKAFELEPSIFLEWRERSRRHAWSIVFDAPSFFHDMRASAVKFHRRTQCAPTANLGVTRRHRTAEPAHGITLVR